MLILLVMFSRPRFAVRGKLLEEGHILAVGTQGKYVSCQWNAKFPVYRMAEPAGGWVFFFFFFLVGGVICFYFVGFFLRILG